MEDEQLVIVFAKPAVPGSVKTRLVPPLTEEEAAAFHLAALADVLALAERVAPGCVELHTAGDDAAVADFQRLFPRLTVRLQSDGDLGDRLGHAFAESFVRGVERALIVGSDHPTTPPEYLSRALARLDYSDVALGPSRDGGYYAVAIRRHSWPRAQIMFQGIPWSSPQVLRASLDRARGAGLNIAIVPGWYDVDRPEDLEVLRRDAHPDSACARYLAGILRNVS
jgi:rSAM/selenodomain-associated transferase 1